MNKQQTAKIEKRRTANEKQPFGASTSTTKGWSIEPHYAIVVSLLYVGIVIILHMIGKYRKDATSV
jgi:hypothetical protein